MIRKFQRNDLDEVCRIWLDTNLKAHDFIGESYWKNHFSLVRDLLPKAEIYVFENDTTKKLQGFIGFHENDIEGIFVEDTAQSHGIGRQLMEKVKERRQTLSLKVYEKNRRAIRFYEREGFSVRAKGMDEATKEAELTMVWQRHRFKPAGFKQ